MSSGGEILFDDSDFNPALEEPLEKTLRCQEVTARGVLDPTDLVLRILSKMEIKERCGRRVGPSLVEPAVGGEFAESETSRSAVVRGILDVWRTNAFLC